MYLATGGKDTVLKIWEVSAEFKGEPNEKANETYKLLNEQPCREYMEHEYDIIDIVWSKDRPNQLLTCSFDQKVILWDLNKETHVQIFEHQDVPSKACFNPVMSNLFVTGCLDRSIRVFSIDQLKAIDTQ
mmetsp:Transcript_32566/g.31802  ORF Transcript_32566/g.31802 Transcript_32566/m.31802 type:complete len:130 (-) Transcript_32566:900-1289(-)